MAESDGADNDCGSYLFLTPGDGADNDGGGYVFLTPGDIAGSSFLSTVFPNTDGDEDLSDHLYLSEDEYSWLVYLESSKASMAKEQGSFVSEAQNVLTTSSVSLLGLCTLSTTTAAVHRQVKAPHDLAKIGIWVFLPSIVVTVFATLLVQLLRITNFNESVTSMGVKVAEFYTTLKAFEHKVRVESLNRRNSPEFNPENYRLDVNMMSVGCRFSLLRKKSTVDKLVHHAGWLRFFIIVVFMAQMAGFAMLGTFIFYVIESFVPAPAPA